MRRSVRLLLVLTGLSVLYLLAFPVPAGTELVVQRAWGLSVASAPATLPETAAPGPDDPPIAVRTNDSFAFIHSDGSIQYRAPVAHEVELATYGFVVYGRAPEQLVLQDT